MIVTDVTANAGKSGPGASASALSAAEREIVSPEEAAANLRIEIGRQYIGHFRTVIIEGLIKEDPVRERSVGEVIGVTMVLIEITQGPESTPGLDTHTIRQPQARKRLEIGFLELDLRLTLVQGDGRRGAAEEFIIHIGRKIQLGVVNRESLTWTLSLVPNSESGNLPLIG